MFRVTRQLFWLLIVVALTPNAQAQSKVLTIGLMNGRGWNILTETERTAYLRGYNDHLVPLNLDETAKVLIGSTVKQKT
jgi:hypothetical protein